MYELAHWALQKLIRGFPEGLVEAMSAPFVRVEVPKVPQQLVLVVLQELGDLLSLVWVCHKHLRTHEFTLLRTKQPINLGTVASSRRRHSRGQPR